MSAANQATGFVLGLIIAWSIIIIIAYQYHSALCRAREAEAMCVELKDEVRRLARELYEWETKPVEIPKFDRDDVALECFVACLANPVVINKTPSGRAEVAYQMADGFIAAAEAKKGNK